jgi:glycogen debranching enzyme
LMFDTRVLSRWQMSVNGAGLEPLVVEVTEPFAAQMVSVVRLDGDAADAHLVVRRERQLSRGMRERIRISNHHLEPAAVNVVIDCEADFITLFDVKAHRIPRLFGRHVHELSERALIFGHQDSHRDTEVIITADSSATLLPGRLCWNLVVDPGAEVEMDVEVSVVLSGERVEPMFNGSSFHASTDAGREGVGRGAGHGPRQRLERWFATIPRVETDSVSLSAVISRSASDLGALRIYDPDHPELPILAAGAPWFMTLFGRDSLLTAWMTLIADPSIAHGVLETLARFQGDDVDPITEEQPGKILHEIRFGRSEALALGGGERYYGSVDATPLFVMLLAEVLRWNANDDLVMRLLPHADRAMEWIENFGDSDGDGFVEYERLNPEGLINQGWKDSWDAIRHGDGTIARGPIALCEVQGYVYGAYRARAAIGRIMGDDATAERYRACAERIRSRFNAEFWVESLGTYAIGLDGDKRPITSIASNVGHCLWTGIVDEDRAPSVIAHLMSDDHFSGFGVRTVSKKMPFYNPVSYHNGSVWPHDNAICAAGLARYGHRVEANRIISAQLDVARAMGYRLPELFAGFGRDHLGVPAPYPSSCSPQAWAAASPLLWLRIMLGLEPASSDHTIWLDPHLPTGINRLGVGGVNIAGRQISIDVSDGSLTVDGLEGIAIQHDSRPV